MVVLVLLLVMLLFDAVTVTLSLCADISFPLRTITVHTMHWPSACSSIGCCLLLLTMMMMTTMMMLLLFLFLLLSAWLFPILRPLVSVHTKETFSRLRVVCLFAWLVVCWLVGVVVFLCVCVSLLV